MTDCSGSYFLRTHCVSFNYVPPFLVLILACEHLSVGVRLAVRAEVNDLCGAARSALAAMTTTLTLIHARHTHVSLLS